MKEYSKIIEEVLEGDPRYKLQAYLFINAALRFLQENMEEKRHVSGEELLEGIRGYALKQYGPLSREVFHCWGVKNCRDFGEIVFNLVEHGLLGKTEQDSREDFAGGYDFKEAFEDPFLGDGVKE